MLKTCIQEILLGVHVDGRSVASRLEVLPEDEASTLLKSSLRA
jgi:hypothetical protein